MMRWSATISAANLVDWIFGEGGGRGRVDVERYVRQRLRDAYDAGKAAALAPAPEVSDLLPLVLYFATDGGRQEMVDAIAAEKPGLITCRVP